MTETIGQRELSQMFQSAAARIRERHGELSALDCVSGDGDHGATMLRIVDQLDLAVRASGSRKPFSTTPAGRFSAWMAALPVHFSEPCFWAWRMRRSPAAP